MAFSVTNRGNGNGFAPMETRPMYQGTAGKDTPILWPLLSSPITREQRPHNVDTTPSGPRIDKVFAANHNRIDLLSRPSPTLPHTITRIVSTGYSSKKKCFPRPCQQPLLITPPSTTNHRPFLTRPTHTSSRRHQSLMSHYRTSDAPQVDNHHTRVATTNMAPRQPTARPGRQTLKSVNHHQSTK